MIKMRILVCYLVAGFLMSCSDEQAVKRDLMTDCYNHYRATSYLVAAKTCQKAAEQDIVEAQWLLANIYEFDLADQGAQPDLAFKWYRRAAEGGWAEAQTIVGEAYLYAIGVDEDFTQAYHWLSKAAEQGDSEAEFSLGQMFFTGKGRSKDTSAAISWFKKAAAKEHLMSINNLAWIYATSEQKAFRNVKKAKYWVEKLQTEGDDQPTFLDTKAAVYAFAGEFVEAISIQNKAIASLPEDVDEERLLEFQKHLETYQQNQSWQE